MAQLTLAQLRNGEGTIQQATKKTDDGIRYLRDAQIGMKTLAEGMEVKLKALIPTALVESPVVLSGLERDKKTPWYKLLLVQIGGTHFKSKTVYHKHGDKTYGVRFEVFEDISGK